MTYSGRVETLKLKELIPELNINDLHEFRQKFPKAYHIENDFTVWYNFEKFKKFYNKKEGKKDVSRRNKNGSE